MSAREAHRGRVRILIADDHSLVRAGARLLLESEWGWEVVGEAGTGREAVAEAIRMEPAVVVIDIGMPELNGLDAARQIKKALPDTEILVLTGTDSEQAIHEVFSSGARAYVLKSDAGKQLIPAVKALCEHQPYFNSRVAEVIFESYLGGGSRPDLTSMPGRLTPREREVVQLLGEGRTTKELAARLGISSRTVETHRAAIMRRLGLKSFSDLIRYAIRNRIIEA